MNENLLDVSYVIPIYQGIKNTDLENLLSTYQSYDKEILKRLLFIFVDDGSPYPVEIKDFNLNYDLYRITDNIPWNQGGARNLGVTMSKTSKLILTDLDHIFTEDIFKKIIKKSIPKHIYQFRRKKNNVKVNRHVNTFFCSKATYFKSLGVDEEFCGRYGYEDLYFKELQKHLGTKFKVFGFNLFIHFKENHQHALERDYAENEKLLNEKLKFLKTSHPFGGHSRLFLNFDWTLVDSKRIL